MRVFCWCVTLLFLTSCTFFRNYFDDGVPVPIREVNTAEVTSVVQELAVEVAHNQGINLEHANTYYNDGIHAIELQFISQDILEMCEARKLIIDVSESLLAKLNQNPLLGEDFAEYPFRPSNLEIYITFETFFGRYIDPYYIAWICMEDGTISYYTFDTLDSLKSCWHVRREAYATSREIVVYERQAEQKYDEAHKLKNPFGNIRYYPEDP